ncbi:hypothetical protein [Methylobacterium sp. NEAU K]|uniref:hypothetical protein n=1 Tax=Methylobacterium sp. NEAU K TaxID=3064946 RepID=UPI002736A2C3|nr:hypothetical protein [Methylobacterium sp. NEAU K]MDP4004918.1 hypothetical protein [Methylobacterium sp. NEAU K]
MSGVKTAPDLRNIVIRGRLWRRAEPDPPPDRGAALASARAAVDAAKTALGERGPAWWSDDAPDFNRRLVCNTPYAACYAALSGGEPGPR